MTYQTKPHAPAVEIRRSAAPADRKAKQRITGCRWIHGDVDQPDWFYCQRPRLARRSYCPEHLARSVSLDGDPHYVAEGAECDLYLRELPPPNDELDDQPTTELGEAPGGELEHE